MPVILALNPGSNSLKFDLVDVQSGQARASSGRKLLSGAVDDIGKSTKLILSQDGHTLSTHAGDFSDFKAATRGIVDTLSGQKQQIDMAAVRVVHGGDSFSNAVAFDDQVRCEMERFAPMAPLHNKNSLLITDVLRERLPDLPVAVAFDTAFHRTLPEIAWRYPIARDVTDQYGIRRYGFHGLSHRYMLEQYAYLAGRATNQVTAVTLHLESGSSACAIREGRSVDTSMGFTPLEGLMMGTRCGSIDPAIVPYLMDAAGLSAEETLKILEKQSGLLGISGVSLDTRVLSKRRDPASLLAMEMFGYRVLHFVGAYLAILGGAEAIVFGGGIGENTPEIRRQVGAGLRSFGLHLHSKKNDEVRAGDVAIHREGSPLAAWVIQTEEGMQLAHECSQAVA